MIVYEPGKEFKVSNNLRTRLRSYLIQVQEEASDELIKLMGQYAQDTTYIGRTGNGAPGDKAWREEIGQSLRRLYVEEVDNLLEAGVGIPSPELAQEVRTMLVAYGSGSHAEGGKPINFGPYGRLVWNDSLTKRDGSKYTGDKEAPEKFNHEGNMFPEKAMDEFKKNMTQILSKALSRIPQDVLDGVIFQ